MRLSYLGELDAECRRVFHVVGRDEMADGPPRLEPFPWNRNFGFFDTVCRDNTDAFAFKILWGGGQRPSPSESEVATTHCGDGHAVNS